MTNPFNPEDFPGRVGPLPFLAVATLSQTGMSFVQQGIVVMGVYFAVQFHLTLAQMGLVTTALSLGVTTSMVFMGVIADRVGPRPLLFWGAMGMAAFSLSLIGASGFLALLVLLYLLGVMLAIAPAAGTKAVFTAFRDRPRGMVMGIRQTGVPLGALLAASLLPRLVHRGIHATFWVFAIELLVVGWLFSGVMRQKEPATVAATRRRRLSREVVGQVWRPALVGVLLVSGQYILLGFSLSDLHRVHHLSLVIAGLVLAAAQLGGGMSRIVSGFVSDRIGGRRAPVIVTLAFLAALMAWAVALVPGTASLWVLAPVWFLFGCGATGWNALTLTWAGESVPVEHSGFAMSGTGTAVFFGSAIFPPLFGGLVDATGRFDIGWILLGALLAVGGLLTWRFSRRPIPLSS